jgi:NAD+ synthase (glutamine-hydrolysing)
MQTIFVRLRPRTRSGIGATYAWRVTRLRVALAQINPTVGDLTANSAQIVEAIGRAEEAEADLVVFPELAITGYPPEDLLLKPGFVADNLAALDKVAAATTRTVAVVGFVDEATDLYNAAALCAFGEVRGIYHKVVLPNYGVFDEARYFAPGRGATNLWGIGGVRVGISVCEDVWSPTGPIATQAAGGAELMININASPYYADRLAERESLVGTRASDASVPLVYVNTVGGQDELVFDGGSLVFDASGRVIARLAQFDETVAVVDLEVRSVYRKRLLDPRGRPGGDALAVIEITGPSPAVLGRGGRGASRSVPAGEAGGPGGAAGPALPMAPPIELEEEVYRALVLGTHDYVEKNGFSDVVIGLSGGIDSAIVATIAADALGPDRVHTVAMPSRYSSEGSSTDAADLASRLGVDHRSIAIEAAHAAFAGMLADSFSGRPEDLTEENMQSRIRGVTLMALSNKLGWLVLTTGNKSEAAVGYSTLYGDTAGGFAVIKDVPKTLVYRLCGWRNRQNAGLTGPRDPAVLPVIPEAILAKPPSAELRPDQRDDQSLPPYDVLDPILEAYVEGDLTAAELVAAGHDEATVRRIVGLVDTAEYKRRQTPPGVRVTPKAFGRDRRMPITNRYR